MLCRYLTYTEWSQFYGGKKEESSENEHIKFKRLPYDHCTITMVPFLTPYCDAEGNVFELEAIFNFIKEFKINPISGKPINPSHLIKLTFHQNADGEYHCPSLFKPFTKNSHIVAVAPTGNVFSYEAIEQLNIKAKNWKDLVDDTPFARKDIISIQDPQHLEKFNISTFHHIRKKLRVETEEEKLERKDPQGRLKTVSAETRDILNELEREYNPSESTDSLRGQPTASGNAQKADKFNAAHYSTGAVAASFTSTAIVPVYKHEAAVLDDSVVRYERVKKKGYARLTTSHGPLNLELFCDVVPKTCENFIKLCQNGYYNGSIFHRSIRNFMVNCAFLVSRILYSRSVYYFFFCRFREAIRLELAPVANPFGARNSRTKFDHSFRTPAAVSFPWPTRAPTRTAPSCKTNHNFINHPTRTSILKYFSNTFTVSSRIGRASTSMASTRYSENWWVAWTHYPNWRKSKWTTRTGQSKKFYYIKLKYSSTHTKRPMSSC